MLNWVNTPGYWGGTPRQTFELYALVALGLLFGVYVWHFAFRRLPS